MQMSAILGSERRIYADNESNTPLKTHKKHKERKKKKKQEKICVGYSCEAVVFPPYLEVCVCENTCALCLLVDL